MSVVEIATPPGALPLVEGEHGACSAGDPREAEAGARILAEGGNAIDAVVAAAFVGFVVEQVDCGLGGFAHVSAWLAGPQRFLAVDGYVRAPAAAHARMFEVDAARQTYYGHPPTVGDAARHGGLAVATPGAVGGLCEVHARGGRLPLAQVLEPAIEHARAGIEITWRDALAIASLREAIAVRPETAATLLTDGETPRIAVQHDDGHRRDGDALASTLSRIAEHGAAGLYAGPVAEALVAAVARAGGVLSLEDLAAYRARAGEEVPVRYRDHAIATCNDHVAAEALQILDGLDLPALSPDAVDYRHFMAEALAVAFTDGIAGYEDPASGSSAVARLRDPAFARRRRADLSERALPRPIAPCDVSGSWDLSGTSQMVAADRDGNLASVITAVGWSYGSLVYVPEAGLFLNNAMSYFDPRPGKRASIAPGKTPMFGAPALVATDEQGRGRLAIAGSGGYRITSGVLHTLSGVVDFRRPLDAAIDHPRVHSQGGPTFVDARIDPKVRADLAARGHDVVVLRDEPGACPFGRVSAVQLDGARVRASAGPTWAAGAAAIEASVS